MIEFSTLDVVVPLVVGLGLGLVHFGGLWLTLLRLSGSRTPAALPALLSQVGRTVFTVAGMYLIMAGRWERLLACLVGFVVMRLVLVHRLRPRHTGPDARREGG